VEGDGDGLAALNCGETAISSSFAMTTTMAMIMIATMYTYAYDSMNGILQMMGSRLEP
jgi:hypothetical protein